MSIYPRKGLQAQALSRRMLNHLDLKNKESRRRMLYLLELKDQVLNRRILYHLDPKNKVLEEMEGMDSKYLDSRLFYLQRDLSDHWPC